MERKVQNQGELHVYGPENVAASQTSTELNFTVNAGQAWRVQRIDIEAPPACTVELVYTEETSGNELSLGTFDATDFPLEFKPTSTDNHLVIWEERKLKFEVKNTTGGQITARAKVQYIKVYLDEVRGK